MARKRTVHREQREHATPHNGYMLTLFAGVLMLLSTAFTIGGASSLTGFAIAEGAADVGIAAAAGMGFLIGLVTVGAAMLMKEPGKHRIGGGIAAVFSIAALLTGVGFILGGLVGLVGAIFALGNV